MSADLIAPGLFDLAATVLQHQARGLQGLFFNPGSSFSLPSLFAALCIAIAFVFHARRGTKRDLKLTVLCRALLPRRILRSPSSRTDLGFLLLNGSIAGAVLGGAFVSSNLIAVYVDRGLSEVFGVLPATGLNDFSARALVTVTLFLAYDLGYWANHYVSHRIPVLWEFHKVHHTAEVLTPFTSFRVHPVDSVVFGNFIAVFTGVAAGVSAYLLGRPSAPFAVGQTNAIFVAFTFLVVHLQHSHFWIAATGMWGRVLVSPAHHQLHHSDDLAHRDRNFGSCLALWDWVFGTLTPPTRQRQNLTFGSGPALRSNHTVKGALMMPFVSAWRRAAGMGAPVRKQPNSRSMSS